MLDILDIVDTAIQGIFTSNVIDTNQQGSFSSLTYKAVEYTTLLAQKRDSLTVGKLKVGWLLVLHRWIDMHDKVIGHISTLWFTVRDYTLI